MRQFQLGNTGLMVPAVITGCMRIGELSMKELSSFVHASLEQGMYFFDQANIYGGGICEEHFGQMMKENPDIRREDIILQSKCGIRSGMYDSSKEHILQCADEILARLQTDYLDLLLIHRPDALVEPEEVAEAFDLLQSAGKVRYFGVSNHRPMQIELLKKYVKQPLVVNQLQFSIPVSNMVAGGLEVNMDTAGSADRDGSVLDYCRVNDITMQAWSPMQAPNWSGCFIGDERYTALNEVMARLAEKYNVSLTGIATAWILRHPAHIQVVSGTSKEARLIEMAQAADITLTREEWYELYLAVDGHILP